MGHSVQRPSWSSASSSHAGKPRKRLELLPEETLYLMEKGALFCWKASREHEDNDVPGGDETEDRDVEWDSASQGAPMSVQQAYAEMIGREALTLDRYQVCEPSYYLNIVLHIARNKNIPTFFEPVSPPSRTIKQ
jgi:tRNA-splicing endonuclease subunit Sen54